MAKVVLHNAAVLYEAFRRALARESRCIIAFRHSSGGEPELLAWYFLYKLKNAAAKNGVRFALPPHALFVYGFEVLRWSGAAARFVMPNLGAMPIHHSKLDSQGMARIYKAVEEGPFPLALAPEGQVSYTTNTVPRLEPGVVRIGFRAAEQLAEKGLKCPVEILPLSFSCTYGRRANMAVESLLRNIEKITGLSCRGRKKIPFTERLRQCRDHILAVNESRYFLKPDAVRSFEDRLERVMNTALETAERMLGITAEGDRIARMYRIRQICWDRIVLPGIDRFSNTSYVERNIMDLQAGEAWYIGRHQELADLCWYFRVPLPAEDSSLSAKIEHVHNLWDFASRTMGGAYADRKRIHPKKIIIHAAPVINLSEQLPVYQANKKAAVAAALSELRNAYEKMVDLHA